MPEVNIPGVGLVTFPYDMPPEQIAAQAQRLYAEAQGKEPSLTRERQPAGAPSALGAGHHQDVARDLGMSPFSQAIGETGETFGRTANDNLPAIAAVASSLIPGAGLPMATGLSAAGAAARQGIRRAAGEGQPMTAEELGLDVAKEGATTAALGGVPRAVMGTLRSAGPAIARNAGAISTAARSASGAGYGAAGIATMNPLVAIPAAATALATSPRVIKGVGNLASRAGNSPALNAIAGKFGLGANAVRGGADTFRKALLDALGADPASTVP
jgi:hypothetical protein